MILDKGDVPALVRVQEEGAGRQYWVGGVEEWMMMINVADPCSWVLSNVYRAIKFRMPSLEVSGLSHYRGWLANDPFTFIYNGAKIVLQKVQFPRRPYQINDEWRCDAIAVFDKAIAIICWPEDKAWTFLPHTDLRPSTYVDAVGGYPTTDYRSFGRVYAVTKPHGNVYVWEPFVWGKSR